MSLEIKRDESLGRRLRLGMVGGGPGGFIGAVHRIAARLDDRFELVAAALSSDPARARAAALDLHIVPERAYGSFMEMAAAEAARKDRIDAVAIVTPNHLHYAPAKTFLEAGIHVICDKPLTTTLEDAKALAGLVESSGRVFVLTHNYTGYPMIRQARQIASVWRFSRKFAAASKPCSRIICSEYIPQPSVNSGASVMIRVIEGWLLATLSWRWCPG